MTARTDAAGGSGEVGAAGPSRFLRDPLDEAASRDRCEALERLDVIARRLRQECPWDREQNERTIVPHTVEEAYELADAALKGDDGKLLDELGDVLYQVVFLALLLEERGAGDLVRVLDGLRAKLIRRHPHVFGEQRARDAAEAVRTWSEVKRRQERAGATFADIAETLPSTLRARKALRRAAAAGLRPQPGRAAAAANLRAALDDLESLAEDLPEDRRRLEVGRILLASVELALVLGVDPELALRTATDQLIERHERAERGFPDSPEGGG